MSTDYYIQTPAQKVGDRVRWTPIVFDPDLEYFKSGEPATGVVTQILDSFTVAVRPDPDSGYVDHTIELDADAIEPA